MKRLKYSWLVVLLAVLCWGCQETEILETYEQVKEITQPVPIAFNPYILSQPESSADTRADLSYLSYISNSQDNNIWYFRYIPCLGLSCGTANTWGETSNFKYNYRFGRTATNSYIVGLYAFAHGNNNWNVASSSASANLMTNQPLLHVPNKNGNSFPMVSNVPEINAIVNKNGNARRLGELAHWDYEPKKYWPANASGTSKVTFVAYYPFQDFEGRDYYRAGVNYPKTGAGKRPNEHVWLSGEEFWDPADKAQANIYDDADLTCITPPAADATGTDAYTFNFRQANNVQKHIDFLLGIKTDQTKANANANATDSVKVPLKHTLCAVKFNFNNLPANFGLEAGKTMEIRVNSIGFKGLYTKGEVYPNADNSAHWNQLANYNAEETTKYGSDENTYMVAFEENVNGSLKAPFMKAGADDRPTFTYKNGSWTYVYQTQQQIYNNGAYENKPNSGGNSRGFRYLLLVIPQTVNNNADAYFEMNYDLSYSWTGGTNSFKNTISRIKLSDSEKSSGDTSQLFIANKMLTFNISITPTGIAMDVSETNWEDDEERQLPIENKETESDSGGE